MYKIVINSQRNSNQSKITTLIAEHPYKLFFAAVSLAFVFHCIVLYTSDENSVLHDMQRCRRLMEGGSRETD